MAGLSGSGATGSSKTGRPKPPRDRSDGLEIDRRGLTLLAALEVEAELLALAQIADPGALDRRDMYEHVFRAVFRLNEAVPLSGVEPFDCTDGHLSLRVRNAAAPRERN